MNQNKAVYEKDRPHFHRSEILDLWVERDRPHLKTEVGISGSKLLVKVGHCKQAIAVFLYNYYRKLWYEATSIPAGPERRIPESFRGCLDGMFEYETNCTYPSFTYDKGKAIADMVERARKITWRTFSKHVHWTSVRRLFKLYSYRGEHRSPLTGELTVPFHIKDDWAVGFYKSVYRGRACYFINHSSIEYIFTRKGDRRHG
jgi:hypothetical protein